MAMTRGPHDVFRGNSIESSALKSMDGITKEQSRRGAFHMVPENPKDLRLGAT